MLRPPHGERFVVLNGADGAWKQPQQAILFLLQGRAFDAVVTLEGFNEFLAIQGSGRLELPANNFLEVNPIASRGYRSLLAAWASSRVQEWVRENAIARHSFAARLLADRVRRSFRKAARMSRKRRTTIEGIFSFPPSTSVEERYRANMASYRWYVRAIRALAALTGTRSAFFIQPVPAIAKKLTAEERRVVGDLEYGEAYRRMARELLSLRDEGVQVFSLLNLFEDVRGTVYADPIHLVRESKGESPGHRLMASAVARDLGTAWGWRRNCSP
ncbi:MAG: hypothetical protein ACE5IL_12490 [Myxococcota bacterium]